MAWTFQFTVTLFLCAPEFYCLALTLSRTLTQRHTHTHRHSFALGHSGLTSHFAVEVSPANLLACNLKRRHRSTACEERLYTGKRTPFEKRLVKISGRTFFSPLALFCREGNLRSLRGGCGIISCRSISAHHSSLKGSLKLSVDGAPPPSAAALFAQAAY